MIEGRRFARLAMPLGLAALLGAPLFADNYDKKTDVTFSEPVQVPGTVLQPGKYMFILLNSSSNRHIVEVKSEDGKHLYAMFMTTAAHRIEPSDKVTINYYEMPAGTPMAIRQWYWPGDLDGQEFLYSHKDAAAIAQATKQKVSEASEEDLAATKVPDNDTDAAAAQPSPEFVAPEFRFLQRRGEHDGFNSAVSVYLHPAAIGVHSSGRARSCFRSIQHHGRSG